MAEPKYRLEGIVRTRSEEMEDFEGPLDVIFLLLSKNKIEIQDVSITAILEQYLAYLDEMKRLDIIYFSSILCHFLSSAKGVFTFFHCINSLLLILKFFLCF